MTPPSHDGEPSSATKRHGYLITLPPGIVGLLSSLYLERKVAEANPFDTYALPLMAAGLLLVLAGFISARTKLRLLELSLFALLCLFFTGKLSYVLFSPEVQNVTGELGEFSVWFPTLYALAYLMFGSSVGQRLSFGYYGITVAVGAAYLLPQLWQGQHPARSTT